MAKNSNNNQVEEVEVEVTEVTRSVKVTKKDKASKKAGKPAKAETPKKSRIKETVGELKKVSWPSFGKTMAQTGMVLLIVLIFGVVVFGIDLLISFIINTLSTL